jgi:GH24 family phage-related lysozyme (muramidase)
MIKTLFKNVYNFFLNLIKEEIEKEMKLTTEKKKTYLDYDWTPVINFETGGVSYYNKFLKKVSWPGGESGLTIGIGADLGYMTKEEFEKFFVKYFDSTSANRLKSVIGLKGASAKAKLPTVKQIELSWGNAMEAFLYWTLPKFWKQTNDLWPGMNSLKENAQIALVSIVFNRGASTKGSSRDEMRNIKPLVLAKDYKGIAKEIRSMKRLWVGKNLDGLLKRRDSEADMVESCV